MDLNSSELLRFKGKQHSASKYATGTVVQLPLDDTVSREGRQTKMPTTQDVLCWVQSQFLFVRCTVISSVTAAIKVPEPGDRQLPDLLRRDERGPGLHPSAGLFISRTMRRNSYIICGHVR